MRANPDENHSYTGYEFGSSNRAGGPNTGGRGRFVWPWQGSQNWTNEDYRYMDIRKTHERMWSKSTFFAGVGFIAFIVWIAALLLKLLFPAKWTFIHGLLGIFEFLGKWVFFIAAGLLVLPFVVGWFFKFSDWLKNRHW